MNYAKLIRDEVYKGIDDTLYVCMVQAGECAGECAAAEVDVMGMILKRELARYTDDAVCRAKASLKGGEQA